MATILVGPGQTKFVLHQALLCDRSQYFAKALTGSFEESKTGTVKLEDVSPVLSKIVVSWLYCGKIMYTVDDDNSNIEHDFMDLKHGAERCHKNLNADDSSTWPKQVLVKLYVLADRFDITELRRNTIDALIAAIRQSGGFGIKVLRFIDSNTSAESPLRRFAIDRLAYTRRHNTLDLAFWQNIPQEMAVRALLLRCQAVPRSLCDTCYQEGLIRNDIVLADDDPFKHHDKPALRVDRCNYHEHADVEEKKKCQAKCASTDDE